MYFESQTLKSDYGPAHISELTVITNFHSAIDNLQQSNSEPIAIEYYVQTTYPTCVRSGRFKGKQARHLPRRASPTPCLGSPLQVLGT